MFDHSSLLVLDVEVIPNMRRTESKAVPMGYGPFPENDHGSGGLTTEVIYRTFWGRIGKYFDRKRSQFDQTFGNMEKKKQITQRLTELQQQAQQSRLAAEAEEKSDIKTHECSESVDADDENHENISSACIEKDPMTLTSFGNIAEPLAPEINVDDALLNEGAEALKSHSPPVEMRMLLSTVNDLLLADTAYNARDYLSATASSSELL